MQVIVDRVEEDYLVLELPNLRHVNVLKELIPDALEKDIIDININYQKRKERENKIELLTNKLFLENGVDDEKN